MAGLAPRASDPARRNAVLSQLSFGLIAGLTRGAVEANAHHGSEELKQKYLPKMISGEWTGAMALTESSAGNDLGLLTSRAEPLGDGSRPESVVCQVA